MRKTMAVLLSALTVLAFAVTPASAAATAEGLWASNYQANTVDCGSHGPDGNTFCYIDDGGAAELGVKFTTAETVYVVGVRVYRVDAGSVTGSLWEARRHAARDGQLRLTTRGPGGKT